MRVRLFLVLIVLMFLPTVTYSQQFIPNYYIPYRVYDTKERKWVDLETLLATAAESDVLFLGEQHNDRNAHKLQLAILQGAARRRDSIVLAMEMFERDVQPVINNYLAGKISEVEFLSQSRPWPNYMTDYRPLVEFAKMSNWSVVGSNAPQRLARSVSLNGVSVVEQLSEIDRKLIAQSIECPHDSYWERFNRVMSFMSGSHGNPNAQGAHGGQDTEVSNNRFEKLYQAQCVKDETMAESITFLLDQKNKPLVVHVNGDFHSAYGEGTAARTKRRLPNSKVVLVSFVPTPDLDKVPVERHIAQGNYLVFTLAEQKNEEDDE